MAGAAQASDLTKQLDRIYGVLEPALDSVGIGPKATPLRRFVVVTLGTAVIVWTKKPDYLFDAEGNPRPLSISGLDEKGVILPWWAFSGLMGTLSVLFI